MKSIVSFVVMPCLCSSASGQVPSGKAGNDDKTVLKNSLSTVAKEETAEGPSSKDEPRVAFVSSIEPQELEGFEHYAPQVRQLIRDALALTKINLTYTFGSSDPKRGGMDCSGTIYHLLKEHGFKDVPRQSNEMCGWVQDRTLLHRIEKADSLKHAEFTALQPGDLLFWSGTYEAGPRNIPVTHVMLYLGKMKKTGRPLMFGASDGRVYQGERRTGVSVFDFNLPKEDSSSKFYGYGMIPGVGRIVHKAPEQKIAEAPEETPAKPAAPVTQTKEAVVAPMPVTPEPEETVKRAIVLKPEKQATASPATKKPSTSTAVVTKKSTGTVVKTKSKSTSAAGKAATPSSPGGRTQDTDMETMMRQKAREVTDSIKNILSR